MTDQELLSDYAERRSEAAFSELVQRHVDFVYSAALRMVCDAHLAEDVAQSTFLALAQNARKLTGRPVLYGWLHLTARTLAAKTVRSDVRRRAREQESAVMNQLLATESNAIWDQVAPHLDAALGDLTEPDRDAVLLRYFQGKSAREMAQTLGTSEEAAQKRVNRAIERLRECFIKRGIAVGTSGVLVSAVAANAISVAPAGLAATISTAVALAGTPVAASTAITTTKAIVMTTLQKAIVAATIAAAAGVGLYETRQAPSLRTEIQSVKNSQAIAAKAEIEQLQKERDGAVASLTALKDENQQLRRNIGELPRLRGEVSRMRRDLKDLAASSAAGNDPFVQKALRWKANEAKLRQLFDDRPNQRVPEMQFIPDDAWLDLAKDEDLESEDGIRKALSNVRHYAKNTFVNDVSDALRRYVDGNRGQLPDDVGQLKRYFKKPVEDALLQQYKLLHTGKLSDVPSGEWIITDTVVDAEYDIPWGIGPGSYGPRGGSKDTVNALLSKLDPAVEKFTAANGGKAPAALADLLPYVSTTAQSKALQQLDLMNVSVGFK